MVRLAVRIEVPKITELAREPTTSTLSSNGSIMSVELPRRVDEEDGSTVALAPKRATFKAPSQSTRTRDEVTSRGSADTSNRDISTTGRLQPLLPVPKLSGGGSPMQRRSVCRLVNRLSEQCSSTACAHAPDLSEEITRRLPRPPVRISRDGQRRSLFAVPPTQNEVDEVRQAKYLQRNSLCTSTLHPVTRSRKVCGPILGPLLEALLRRTSDLQRYRSHPNNTNNGFDPFDSPPPPPPQSPLVLPSSYRNRLQMAGFTVDEPCLSITPADDNVSRAAKMAQFEFPQLQRAT